MKEGILKCNWSGNNAAVLLESEGVILQAALSVELGFSHPGDIGCLDGANGEQGPEE